MNVGLKARTLGIELPRKLQVIHNLSFEHFAGNQQWNAGRVRRDQADGDAPFQVVNFNPLSGAVRNVSLGVAGLHSRLQVALVDLCGQPCNVVFGVHGVDVLA